MAISEACQNLLLDIGTVCPISFVKETLFPYALHALPGVLARKWDDADFWQYRNSFPAEHRHTPQTFQSHVEDLTKHDVKVAYLKNLQGYLWEDGYKSQVYSTPLFPDVAPFLRRWKLDGKKVAVYSSGSVFAQKLLFAHVKVDGGQENLTELMDGWFDTSNAGSKTEASSYHMITDDLKWSPKATLFLTDNVKEIDAALEAGLCAQLVERPGNAPVCETDRARLTVINSFDALVANARS